MSRKTAGFSSADAATRRQSREEPFHRGTRDGSARRDGPSQRQLRVSEEIRHVLAGAFERRDFRDPELATSQITVTEVRLTPDLKHAQVYVSRLGRSDVDLLLPALERASAYLRGQVAQAMRLRYAPNLHFHADHALDYAMKIDQLMHQPEVARDLDKPE